MEILPECKWWNIDSPEINIEIKIVAKEQSEKIFVGKLTWSKIVLGRANAEIATSREAIGWKHLFGQLVSNKVNSSVQLLLLRSVWKLILN